MNNTMDCVGCPACVWPLCAIFALMLFCHLPNSNGEIPIAVHVGQILDISKFMHFHFWQKFLVELHQKDKTEELARWCYPTKGVGDELTYMVLLTNLNSWCHAATCNRLQILSNQTYANNPTPVHPCLHLLPHLLTLKLCQKRMMKMILEICPSLTF